MHRLALPVWLALAFALLAPPVARADEDLPYRLEPAKSSITYHCVHKFHKFGGTSHAPDGKARLLRDKVQVMVRALVETFDSGNANRDEHMKEVMEVARFPYVELKLVDDALVLAPGASMDRRFRGELSFHGERRPVDVPVHLTVAPDGSVHATAHFTISLDVFKVQRPSLLFVKVDDALEVDADVVFRKP